MSNATALLSLDMINELVHPNGKFASFGYPEHAGSRNTLPNAATAQSRARAAGIPVIHVTVGFSPDYSDWPAQSLLLGGARENQALKLGSWGTDFHEAVKPAAGEPIIAKPRISPSTTPTLRYNYAPAASTPSYSPGCPPTSSYSPPHATPTTAISRSVSSKTPPPQPTPTTTLQH
ncbi:hypothetical protein CRH09_15290 [Nocardia terpenica]|uniref:Isochorismatase-like domain-containing protein n=1 Tax=Nocardia terpenica TaxID=455432 RepID=A0A291RIZ2_9NOCA|nr:hypothetical protein CRH09_15290 [Nocardia terpenica]